MYCILVVTSEEALSIASDEKVLATLVIVIYSGLSDPVQRGGVGHLHQLQVQ